MITVHWGNRLETLAGTLFGNITAAQVDHPADALRFRPCVIVPNRIVQSWLQQAFLFRPAAAEVLANWEFPLLNVFVNDRLFRMMDSGTTLRDPEAHPFSREAMAWRLFRLLEPAALRDPVFAPLADFVRPDVRSGADDRNARRRFKLANRLAILFDEYMVYRPETLLAWQRGDDQGVPTALAWQPALWRRLVAGGLDRQTYLASFVRMREPEAVAQSGVAAEYRRIHVFGAAMMPRVYIHFFECLATRLPVDFYVLNPSSGDWFEAPGVRESLLEGRRDTDDLFDPGNVFLGQQGRGNRNFLAELLDRTDGRAEAQAVFVPPQRDTLLHALQAQICANEEASGAPVDEAAAHTPGGSVQVHVCHGPMREVEVLHDHLLRWFSESSPSLQPRQVQVQVADMSLYAPYIHAVFATRHPDARDAIPYAVVDRIAASESAVAIAFTRLLELGDSRFTAPEILELLHCEAVREAVGLELDDIEAVARWTDRAGIRWGRSIDHRETVVGVRFESATSWCHGLDRLLLGYAYGRSDVAEGTELPLPCDCVEDEDAVTLGQFVTFVRRLEAWAERCAGQRRLSEWADALDTALDTFFASTNDTYAEVKLVRAAIGRLRKSAHAATADDDRVGIDVVRDFIVARLQDVLGGDDPSGNVVVFSALRPGSSMPRRVVCLLGMSDGAFPRSDNRPAYDLLRHEHRFGDRSLRQEDRMAFLEAVLSARERLYISYTGFTAEENRSVPPSVVLAEWLDALDRTVGRTPEAPAACRPVIHRLQRHHPAYFAPATVPPTQENELLFSYARTAFATARALAGRREKLMNTARPTPLEEPDETTTPAVATTCDLEELIRFFRNPAKAYYTDVLGVSLEIAGEAALAEQETFSPEGLDRYAATDAIVQALIEDESLSFEPLRRRLLEDGKIPLGHRGQEWFDDTVQSVQKFLEDRIADGSTTPLQLLRAWHRSDATRITLALPPSFRLSGSVRTAPDDGADNEPDVRLTKDKEAERLACWIRHLFTCATGHERSRLYVRKHKSKGDSPIEVRFDPVSAKAANEHLAVYTELFRQGQQCVLPYTTAVATAYVTKGSAEIAKGSADADTVHREALAAAQRQWHKSGRDGIPAENDDPYYQAAFGKDGPCADERRFAEIARAVFAQHPELIS